MMYSKQSQISDTEYDPSRNANSSFHAGADLWNLMILYDFLFFPCIVYVKI